MTTSESSAIELLSEAARAVECNLYRIGVRARLAAMPLLGQSTPGNPWTLITAMEIAPCARGLGYGSRLLRQATTNADEQHITLALSVVPDGSRDGLDEETLIAWYARYGFVTTEDPALALGPITMVRQPRTPTT